MAAAAQRRRNVSLAVTPPPPVANNDSGFVATENTALSISGFGAARQRYDPNGSPLSITGVSNPINGTVSYDASTQTVTFVPSTAGDGQLHIHGHRRLGRPRVG